MERLKLWIAAILWMSVIFVVSSDIGSAAHTSRFLEPLVRWVFPGISQHGLEWVHFVIRKCGHLAGYAVLGILLLRALARPTAECAPAWNWKPAAIALAMSAAYAAGDEFHQSFVPSRGASIQDVLIDTCGSFLGLSLMRACKLRGSL